MVISNLSTFSIFTFLFSLLFLWYYIFWWLKNNRKKIEILFLCLAFFFAFINVFEIKWPFKSGETMTHWNRILFALDVSRSMDTIDVGKRSRLDAAKDFMFRSLESGNEYALVVFWWEALEVLPFTSDLWLFQTIAHWVDYRNLSRQWTNMNALFWVIENFFPSKEESGFVVILSDGWDEEENILEDYQKSLQEKNIKWVVVWVWTKEGNYIPTGRDVFWRIIYKTYRWEKVISKLNEEKLKDIASDFSFGYMSLKDSLSIDSLKEKIYRESQKVSLKNQEEKRIDMTRILIFFSFVFFLLYFIFANFWTLWKRK